LQFNCNFLSYDLNHLMQCWRSFFQANNLLIFDFLKLRVNNIK